jgi:hypothetical protein
MLFFPDALPALIEKLEHEKSPDKIEKCIEELIALVDERSKWIEIADFLSVECEILPLS